MITAAMICLWRRGNCAFLARSRAPIEGGSSIEAKMATDGNHDQKFNKSKSFILGAKCGLAYVDWSPVLLVFDQFDPYKIIVAI